MSAGSYDYRPNCPNRDSRDYEIRMISHSYKSQNQRDHSSDEQSNDPGTPTPGLKSNHRIGVPSVKGAHVGEDQLAGA